MSITIREAVPAERPALVPLLGLAEPSERALRWSLSNLSDALYRMDSIRHDYFWYSAPRFEHGIRVRDLLVFRYDLTEDAGG